MVYKSLLLLQFVVFSFCLQAQEQKFEESTLKKLKADYPYSKVEEETPEKEEVEDPKDEASDFSFPIRNIFLVIFGLIVLAFVLAVVWKLKEIRIDAETGHSEKLSFEDVVDESTQKDELQLILDEALLSEDYKLAIRVLFLMSLQILDERKHLNIERGKTISGYLIDLNGKQVKTVFSELSYLFNYAWYGGFTIPKSVFDSAEKHYQEIYKMP